METYRLWGVMIDTCKSMPRPLLGSSATQRGVCHSIHPLHRLYHIDHLHLHRQRDDTFYMDTLFFKLKSLNGHTCAKLITNGTFTRIYPMESKASSNNAQALTEFIDYVEILGTLIWDLATEKTGKNTDVLKAVRRFQIRLLSSKKDRDTTQNHKAKTEMREVKTKWKTQMRENRVPARLWDDGLVYIAEIQSLLARGQTSSLGLRRLWGKPLIFGMAWFRLLHSRLVLGSSKDWHEQQTSPYWTLAWDCTLRGY